MKAGEDPNLSNPVPEPEEQLPLDPNDPEVQVLNASDNNSRLQNGHHQPSIIEAPDEHDRIEGHLAQRSTYDESLHSSRAPSAPPQISEEGYYHNAAPPEVSPLAPSDVDQTSVGGAGYFPTVPDTISRTSDRSLPDVAPSASALPPSLSASDSSIHGPTGASGFHPSHPPPTNSLHSFPPPSMDDSDFSTSPLGHVPTYPSAPVPTTFQSQPVQPSTAPRHIPQTPIQPPLPTPGAPVRQAGPVHAMAPPPMLSQTSYSIDEEAILKAQKHARWAISALNFEDVNTAVKELRGALESLGAN